MSKGNVGRKQPDKIRIFRVIENKKIQRCDEYGKTLIRGPLGRPNIEDESENG